MSLSCRLLAVGTVRLSKLWLFSAQSRFELKAEHTQMHITFLQTVPCRKESRKVFTCDDDAFVAMPHKMGIRKQTWSFFWWNTSWHTFSKQLVWFGWSKLCRISGSIRFHVLLCYCTGRLSLDFLLSHHARPEMPVGHGNRFHNMICHAENGQKKRGTKPKPNLPSRGTHLITMFYIL